MPSLNQTLLSSTAKSRFQAGSTRTSGLVLMQYDSYIEGIARAIVLAHDEWRRAAHFAGVIVNGPTAAGGRLVGPTLEPFIVGNGPQSGAGGNAFRFTTAIAYGIAQTWTAFQQSVSIPSLPWYPGFAAFPGPAAPPTPNVTTAMSLLSSNRTLLAAPSIATRMQQRFGQPVEYSAALFTAVAEGFATAATAWLSVQNVTMALGTGPVPSFAPPARPFGPVQGGYVIAKPSHLAV